MRVALDCMGGDKGPGVNVEGAVEAVRENPKLTVLLVGDQAILQTELRQNRAKFNPEQLVIQHASETITMDDPPALAARQKRQSSIHIANQLVKQGEADAVFTAGNTGAAMGVSLLVLGRIPGIIRPALMVTFPSLTQQGWTILLDVGANVDCKPKMLAQFAVMGELFCRQIMGITTPRVGLLSVGEEDSKGNELIHDSQEFFKKFKTIRYIGNVEGQDIINGQADVVVCDGFVGNAILKFGEGTVRLFGDLLKKEMMKNGLVNRLAGWVLLPALRRMYRSLDYQKYGSAPLLGVKGISSIGHGKSSAKAIKNALLQSAALIEKHINDKIALSLRENGVAEA